MTTQLSSTITCPRWCAGRHDDLGDPRLRVHVLDVGYGVEITAEERRRRHRGCPGVPPLTSAAEST